MEVSKGLREDAVSVSSCLLSALAARELRLCVGLSLGEKSFVVLKLALAEWGECDALPPRGNVRNDMGRGACALKRAWYFQSTSHGCRN